MSSTKEIFLDDLTAQLQALTTITKATRQLLPPDEQEGLTPYIGVKSDREVLLVSNEANDLYHLQVILQLTAKEDEYSIENVIEDVKDLIKTIDLGSAVYRTTYLESGIVDIEDIYSDNYSGAEILLEIYYTQTYDDVAAATNIEDWDLTQPIGYSLYKVYETLVSGSTSIQPLGTNIYPRHNEAALAIPTSSGSITIDVVECIRNEDESAIYDDELSDEYLTTISIRIQTGYLTEDNSKQISMPMVDNIRNLLWGNSTLVDLGDAYRTTDWNAVSFDNEFEATVGAVCTVEISKVLSDGE